MRHKFRLLQERSCCRKSISDALFDLKRIIIELAEHVIDGLTLLRSRFRADLASLQGESSVLVCGCNSTSSPIPAPLPSCSLSPPPPLLPSPSSHLNDRLGCN